MRRVVLVELLLDRDERGEIEIINDRGEGGVRER